MSKIATRDGFGDEIVELGRENKNILVVDVDIGKSCKTTNFAKQLPAQHVNVGIAEQSGAGVAAGLATCGKIPFVVTYAAFGSMRMCEMIRQEICYPHLNVKIACSHGGVTPANDGASHQCCEDFALMRSIPGMVVICPADGVEAEAAVKAAYEYQGPVYLRMGRLAIPVFHEDGFKFKIGKGEILREGTDIAIIANGLMTYEAIKAGEALEAMGIHARIVNMSTIKPLDEELVLKCAKECGKIITCEEHSIIGGLGEAVCSYLAETCPVPVKRIGVNDKFGCSGTAAEVLKAYGLSAEHIVEVTKAFLNR